MLDNCDSVRKGLIYTPNLNDHLEEDAAVSFEQKRGINYQHEYMRLYIANVVLTQQLKELLQEKGDLVTKIGRLEETENVKVHHPRSQQMKHQESEQHSIRNKSSEMQQQKHSKSHSGEGNMQNYMKQKYQQDENACPNHQYQTRKLIRKN